MKITLYSQYLVAQIIQNLGAFMKNILEKQLYIRHVISVMESHLTHCYIPMDNPRRSDCFCYVLSGSCIFTLEDGRSFEAQSGDVVFLAEGSDYSMNINCEHYSYMICNFLFPENASRHSMLIKTKNTAAFEKEFRKLAKEFAIKGPGWWVSSLSILLNIYSMLVREQQSQYVPSGARASILKARNWIQTHLTDPSLSVSFLANQAKMSEVHFRELFRDVYHITPAKYITQERITHAKQLMELKELRLEDIALQSGFSSLPYFCKVFKATTGTTPAVYRHKLQ